MTDDAYLARCRQRMAEIDAQPAEIRAVVQDEGWTVVKAFLECGVKKARQIRHLIRVVREGSDAYGNGTRGEKNRQRD